MRLSRAAQTRAPRAVAAAHGIHCCSRTARLFLGIVLGMPVGRWHAEFTVATPAAREALRWLRHAIGVDGLSQLLFSNAVALGMVVLQSWRFVHDIASHERTWCMLEAVKAAHRRCNGIHFLEHVVLATHVFDRVVQ